MNLPSYQNKKIAALYRARPPAPDGVWNFRGYATWQKHIWELIADFADADVRSKFMARRPGMSFAMTLAGLTICRENVLVKTQEKPHTHS
jgi:hypothetical protein